MNLELPLFVKALDFAAEKHKFQKRKGLSQIPYINHPIQVAKLLMEVGKVTDVEVLAAALLHDTIEDTTATADELQALFGERVTGIVLEVTDDKKLASSERKRYQITKAPRLSQEAKLVKLADKTCNVTDIVQRPPNWTTERKRKYLMWAKKVVDALGGGVNEGLEELFDSQYRRGMEALNG